MLQLNKSFRNKIITFKLILGELNGLSRDFSLEPIQASITLYIMRHTSFKFFDAPLLTTLARTPTLIFTHPYTHVTHSP